MVSLLDAAKVTLLDCMGLKKNESVLIVTDHEKVDIAEALLTVAAEITNHAGVIIIPVAKFHGAEPPNDVANIMKKHDVIILATTMSLSHTKARRDATKKGSRIASMPGITAEIMKRALVADYKKISKWTKKLNHLIYSAGIIHVTTKLGTDISFIPRKKKGSIDILKMIETKGLQDDGIFRKKGRWGNLPSGESCLAPLEGTTNGVLVIDASVLNKKVVEKNEKIKVTIKDGYAVKIEGGVLAGNLRKILKSMNDISAYNIAELGIGTNYKAKVTGNILEDEKVMGTAHFAFGNNMSFGGIVNAPCHDDAVFFNPTVKVDGKIIIQDGKFVFNLVK